MKKKTLFFIGFAVCYLMVQELLFPMGISILLGFFFSEKEMDSSWMDVFYQTINYVPFVVFALFFNKKVKEDPYIPVHFKLKDLFYAIGAFLSICILNICYSTLKDHFSIHTVNANQDMAEHLIKSSQIIMFIVAVVIAPLAEEFFFRKIIIGHIFAQKKWIGLIISSLLFGLGHMEVGFDWFSLLGYVTMGFIFGILYIKTKRIETSLAAHIFNNLVATLVALFLV